MLCLAFYFPFNDLKPESLVFCLFEKLNHFLLVYVYICMQSGHFISIFHLISQDQTLYRSTDGAKNAFHSLLNPLKCEWIDVWMCVSYDFANSHRAASHSQYATALIIFDHPQWIFFTFIVFAQRLWRLIVILNVIDVFGWEADCVSVCVCVNGERTRKVFQMAKHIQNILCGGKQFIVQFRLSLLLPFSISPSLSPFYFSFFSSIFVYAGLAHALTLNQK